jgi:alkaline phosphatase
MKSRTLRLFLIAVLAVALPFQATQAQKYVAPEEHAFDGTYHSNLMMPLEGVETPYTHSDNQVLERIDSGEVRNVILMIGDGMSLAHINMTRFYIAGPDALLHMETMPVTGIMKTHSADELITDSAASSTAIATGHKTDNRRIGTDPDNQPLPNITEALIGQGMAIGLVSTSSVTHATPAGFLAHTETRYMMDEIAAQMATARPEVLFGGGRGYFLPNNNMDSKREDDRDLVKELQQDGYTIATTRAELLAAHGSHVLGLMTLGHMKTRRPEPMLAEMTAKAIDILVQDEEGFFLMVEGSQIDWAGHNNDGDYMIRETLLFDDAVREALTFAKEDGQTLVIVTSDHETGGLTIRKGKRDGSELNAAWSSPSHTAVNVPVYAYGPGALHFTGVFDNTEIAWKLAKLYDVENLLRPKN